MGLADGHGLIITRADAEAFTTIESIRVGATASGKSCAICLAIAKRGPLIIVKVLIGGVCGVACIQAGRHVRLGKGKK